MRPIPYIVVSIFCFISASAQPRQYVFNRVSAKEGLASNFVYTIFQDKKGFMWFGTANGLQRYDGKKIIQFRPPPGSEDYLPPVSIAQMFEDKKGNIWVRTGKEVGIFDPATFRYKRASINIDKTVHPRASYQLWQDSQGQIFLLITRVGLLPFDSLSNTFSAKNQPVIRVPANWSVNSVAEDPSTGNYWLGCDSGLALYDQRRLVVYSRNNNPSNIHLLKTRPNNTDPVTILFADASKKLWITSWNAETKAEHYAVYDLAANRFTNDTSGLQLGNTLYRQLHGFMQHSSGDLWAFGRMQLYSFDQHAHRFNYFRNEHLDDYGIKYDYVFSIYEDKEHNLWFGTDQGVYAVNTTAQAFQTIRGSGNGKPVDISVTGFLQTSDNKIFASTWGSGLVSFDEKLWPISNNVNTGPSAADNNYDMQWCLFQQPGTDRLWIGCQSGRLIMHDLKTKQNRFLVPRAFDGKTVRQIIQDRCGKLWFATQYGHLVKWSNSSGDPKNIGKELSVVANLQTIIYKLYEDKEGYIWAATHEYGLIKIDPSNGKTVAVYTSKLGKGRSLYSDIVTDITPYGDSLLIVASGALNFLNRYTGEIKQVSANDGLPSNTINSLLFDQQGSLWISLLSGLCRYNISKNLFTSFSHRDGIFYDNFQIGARYMLKDGRMLFGNTHDFVSFQPAHIVSGAVPPDATITGFKLFNDYLPPDSISRLKEVRLAYNKNSITFEFAALSFLQNDNIAYFYKLEGIDKDWYRSERSLFANYTQLPPGNYRFMVWCENSSGGRSSGITTLNLQIVPPFWKTGWFMILMVLALAGLIYLAHRIRINRLMVMEKVRRRIARDLHDDMGSTLSTINILSEMAKMKVGNDSGKTKEYIEKISDNSSRMMDAMDDIVWSINPMNDSMLKVSARMREFATGVLEAKNIDFCFKVDEAVHDLKLDMEARRDFFLLFKEAVNNMAKYSGCSRADIEIRIVKSMLLMRISDDGVGFQPGTAGSGNGLNNMKKRAQNLKGKLDINSILNKGTSVLLEAPVS